MSRRGPDHNYEVALTAATDEWKRLTATQQATLAESSGLACHRPERSWQVLVRKGLAKLRIDKDTVIAGWKFPDHHYSLTAWGAFVRHAGRVARDSAPETETE